MLADLDKKGKKAIPYTTYKGSDCRVNSAGMDQVRRGKNPVEMKKK